MSAFLAEALVVVKPDTSKFRTQLENELRALKVAPLVVPVVASAAGLSAAAAATGTLAAAQARTEATSTGLLGTTTLLNSRWAQQAVILEGTAAATGLLAGAQVELDLNSKRAAGSLLGAGTASAKLDAALLGLRTALGSTAVIGLGALALAAIVAGKAISASIKNFASFQQELATFRVTAGATAQEMRAVSEQAARLGADVRLPAVSAADAAIAMTELAKAGLTVEQAMAGAEGVLQLATAAQISNADAALIAANALNSFGLAGDQAIHVADDLANAANAAQGSISDFGQALEQSSAVARQVGLSLDDTVAILSLFAKNGLQGSDAGTSLRVALIKLAAPTDKARVAIEQLGLKLRDAQGNFRADVFAQFGEATRQLTPAVRDATAALIFGQDAIRAVAIGAREGTDGLRLMQFQIDQQGTAAEVSAARTEGLAGAFSSLQSGAQTLSIEFGKVLSLGITPYVKVLATAISLTSKFAEALDGLATAALNAQTPLGKVKDRMFDILSVGVPLLGEVRLIQFGIDKLGIGADKNAEKITTLQGELQNLQKARIDAEKGGQSQIADQLTKEIKALKDEIAALKGEGKGITSSITDPLAASLAALKKVRDIRISLNVDTSGIDRLIAALKEQIPITQQVEGNIARLRDDITGLGTASSNAVSAVDALAAALAGLGRKSAQTQAELLRLQTEGGTSQQQIAVIKENTAAQRQIIADIQKNGNQTGDASAITKARNQIKANDAEIAGLVADIQSSSDKAAKKISDAQTDGAKKFQDALATALRGPERLLERAGGTDPLKDDIKFRKQLIAILKRKIDEVAKVLGNTEEARKIIKGIQDRILSEALNLKNDQVSFRRQLHDALVARLERAQKGIELDIELADINENTKRRISLREKLIQQLKNERKKLHLTGNALKENRNEIARINAEIEEIRKEEKKTSNQFAQLSFQILQMQQGFTSKLLSNLIPGSATAGLVGGGSTAAQAAIRPPGMGVTQESQIAQGKDAGFSAGQGNTTNSLLRQIRDNLKILNGHSAHPEARNQRIQQSGSAFYHSA